MAGKINMRIKCGGQQKSFRRRAFAFMVRPGISPSFETHQALYFITTVASQRQAHLFMAGPWEQPPQQKASTAAALALSSPMPEIALAEGISSGMLCSGLCPRWLTQAMEISLAKEGFPKRQFWCFRVLPWPGLSSSYLRKAIDISLAEEGGSMQVAQLQV